MTQEDLQLLANIVRLCAERRFRSKSLARRCSVVSYCFWRIASREADVRLVGGNYLTHPTPAKLKFGDPEQIEAKRKNQRVPHAWTVVNGEIWDLTATQFEGVTDRIYICPRSNPRYAAADMEWTGVLFRSALGLLDSRADAAVLLRDVRSVLSVCDEVAA